MNAALPARADLNGSVTFTTPTANDHFAKFTVVDFKAKIDYSRTSGDTNTYEIVYEFYLISPAEQKVLLGSGSVTHPTTNFSRVDTARYMQEDGTWQFWAFAKYRVAGSQGAFTTLVSEHV